MELCLLNAENIPDGCLLSVSAGGSRRQAALAPKQKFAFSNASAAAAVAAGGSGLKVDLLSVQGSACVTSSELLPGLQKALGAGGSSEGGSAGHQIEVIVTPPGQQGTVEEDYTMKLNFNIKPTSKDREKERDGAETSRFASGVNTARTEAEERPFPTDLLKQSALLDRTAATLGPAGPKAHASPQRSSRRHHAALQARSYLDDHNILNFIERVLRTLVQDRPADPWSAIAALLPEAAAAGAMPESIKPEGPLGKLEEEKEEVKEPEWNMMPSVGTWYMIPTPVIRPQKDSSSPGADAQEEPLLSTRGEEVEHERAVAGQFVEDLVAAASTSPAKATSQGCTSPMVSVAAMEVDVRHRVRQHVKEPELSKAAEVSQPWHLLASVGTWYAPLRPSLAVEETLPAVVEDWRQRPSVGTWYMPLDEPPLTQDSPAQAEAPEAASSLETKALEVTSAPRPLKGTGISSSTVVAFVLPSLDFEQLVASEQSGILLEEVKVAMNQFAVRSLRAELGGADPEGVEVRMTIKNASSNEAKALKAEILQAEESFLAEVEQRLSGSQLRPSSGMAFQATDLHVMVRHTASFEEGPVDGHATASTMAPATATMYATGMTGNALSSAMPTQSQWAPFEDTSSELPKKAEAEEQPSTSTSPPEDVPPAGEADFVPKLLLDPYAMEDGSGTSPMQSAVSDARLCKEREEAAAATKRRAAKAAAARIPEFLVDPYALEGGTGTSPMQSAVSETRLAQERQAALFATYKRSAEDEFAKADANHDGVVTVEEFEAWAHTKDLPSEEVQPAVVAAAFQVVDTNHDGVLSKEEFERYYVAKAAEELHTPSDCHALSAEVTEAALDAVAQQLLTDLARKDLPTPPSDCHARSAEGTEAALDGVAEQLAWKAVRQIHTPSDCRALSAEGTEAAMDAVAQQLAWKAVDTIGNALLPKEELRTPSDCRALSAAGTEAALDAVAQQLAWKAVDTIGDALLPKEELRTPSDCRALSAEVTEAALDAVAQQLAWKAADMSRPASAGASLAGAAATGNVPKAEVASATDAMTSVAEPVQQLPVDPTSSKRPASTAAMESESSQAPIPSDLAEVTLQAAVAAAETTKVPQQPAPVEAVQPEAANAEDLPTPSDCQALGAEVTEAALDAVAQQLLEAVGKDVDTNTMGSDPAGEAAAQGETAKAVQAAAAAAAAPASAAGASLVGTAATGNLAPELPKIEVASATDAMTSVAEPVQQLPMDPTSSKPPASTAAMESESSQAPIPSDLAEVTLQAAVAAEVKEAAEAAKAAAEEANRAAEAAKAAEQQVQQAVVAASFEAMDTNKDGVVSKEEFENYVAKAAEGPTRAEPEAQQAPPEPAPVEAAQPEADAEEDAEAIQERVNEVLEENSRLRSENMALRVELDALLAMAVTPETTPPGTAK